MNESFIQSTKPRDTDPPEFILSFNVMVAPPTYVTCQVGSTPVNVAVLSREVTAAEYQPSSNTLPVTNVNVTLRIRQAGDYQCTVSVLRVSGNNLTTVKTSPITISGRITIGQLVNLKETINYHFLLLPVTDTPTNVKSELTGYYIVQLSWSAPASNTPPVAGYEVFYAVSGSNITQSGGTTTTDTITINVTLTLANQSGMYDFFVVAFSDADNALPSAHSNNSTIDLSELGLFTMKAFSIHLMFVLITLLCKNL